MPNKRNNILREYHLLIKREAEGFAWQIRYNRHANPIQHSMVAYPSQGEAAAAGEAALTILKREAAALLS